MACLCGESVIYEANVEAVEQDLVRCFVNEELRNVNGGWDPRRTPWLTIDSEGVQEIVEYLTCLAAAGIVCYSTDTSAVRQRNADRIMPRSGCVDVSDPANIQMEQEPTFGTTLRPGHRKAPTRSNGRFPSGSPVGVKPNLLLRSKRSLGSNRRIHYA